MSEASEAATILLVEDNQKILAANQRILQSEGYRVLTATSLAEARQRLAADPALIILDIMLPDGDGLDLIPEIRRRSLAPILLLTSLAEKQEILQGLRAGGDDYITKPYDIDELCARVAAFLRRAGLTEPTRVLRLGALSIDLVAARALIRGQDMLLTPKEFAVLHFLALHPKQAIAAQTLYLEVWQQQMHDDGRALKTCISRLRRKLADGGFAITAQRGLGYCLEPPPQQGE